MEKSLKRLQAQGMKYMSLEDVRKEAEKIWKIEEEIDFTTVVDFFHDRHVALHYTDTPDLAKHVLLDAEWLIERFGKVITVPPKECQLKDHWEQLEEKGELHPKLVEDAWKDLDEETITWLLSILEKFGLACPWTKSDGTKVCNIPLPHTILIPHVFPPSPLLIWT